MIQMFEKIKQMDDFTIICLIEILILFFLIILSLNLGYLGPITHIKPQIDFLELVHIVIFENPLFSNTNTVENTIIWEIRIPRVFISCLCGIALGISGTLIQAIFKNPLGDPYILGVSSGASVGAALYFILNSVFISTYLDLSIFAFIGGLCSMFILYLVANKYTNFHPAQVILIGIAISSIGSSITMFLTYIADKKLKSIVFWLFGSFSNITWEETLIMCIIVFIGILISFFYVKELNILLLGSLTAHHLGLDVKRTRKIILLLASSLTAISVAFTGVIGFVGLIIPHIMRSLLGPNHKRLLPATILAGPIFLLFSDLIARLIFFPTEIPIGIITAFFGGLFFLYILLTQQKGVFFD